MVVETNDPDILAQIAALFASQRGEEDWWDTLSEGEKKRIEAGQQSVTVISIFDSRSRNPFS